jgi:hypothetical protein
LPRPKKSFSPEFKDEAVKMVIETSRPIARVAKGKYSEVLWSGQEYAFRPFSSVMPAQG